MVRHTCLLILVVALVLAFSPSTEAGRKRNRLMTRGLKRDRSALMALEKSVSDTGRSSLPAWKARGNPCIPKPWPHITCSAGRVASIDLANLEIVGTLPSQLKRLNRLRTLNLENNMFTGSIPQDWSHPRKFRNLQILHLSNNMLTGTLPNRRWNRKNAFRSLHTIILADNLLSGGLPDGWLSTSNSFRRLKFLDLADNQLGNNDAGEQMADGEWCLEGRTDDSGWCPTVVSKARAFALETLDLSGNNMKGQLPMQWGQMFPNLQFLMIQRNQLYAGSEEMPAALPTEWTRNTVPRAFPQLEALVLYPGNTYICNLPDVEGGFQEVNGDMTYVVEGEDMVDYDSQNPWFCPGATEDNAPTGVELTTDQDLDTLQLKWTAPSDMSNVVYGYKVSVSLQNVDTEEWGPVPGWTSRLLEVHGDIIPEGLSSDGGDPPTYTMATSIIPDVEEGESYKLEVATFNMNGVESVTDSATKEFT